MACSQFRTCCCCLFSDLVQGLNREVTSNSWANTAIRATPVHYGKVAGPPPVMPRSGLTLKGHWLPDSKLSQRPKCDSCLESINAGFIREFIVFLKQPWLIIATNIYCLFSVYGLNRKRNVSIFKKKLANTACGPGRGMDTLCSGWSTDGPTKTLGGLTGHTNPLLIPHLGQGGAGTFKDRGGMCVCVGGEGVGPSRAEEACVWGGRSDLQGQRRLVWGWGGGRGGGDGPWVTYLQPIFSPKDHRLKLQPRQKTLLQEMEVTTDHERDEKNIHSERVQKMTPTRPFIAPRSLLKSKMNSNIFKCNLPALYTTFLSDKFQCLLEPFQGLGLLSIERQVFLAIPALVLKLFNRKSLSGKDY